MKVFVAKYALSSGILERECDAPDRDGYVFVVGRSRKIGVEAFTERDAAEAAARAMAEAKIVSLRKQITKLGKLATTAKWAKR